jgi:hypothetical protein
VLVTRILVGLGGASLFVLGVVLGLRMRALLARAVPITGEVVRVISDGRGDSSVLVDVAFERDGKKVVHTLTMYGDRAPAVGATVRVICDPTDVGSSFFELPSEPWPRTRMWWMRRAALSVVGLAFVALAIFGRGE